MHPTASSLQLPTFNFQFMMMAMEEFDSHTEHAQEQAHEAAHESREKWITGVALTAAILAALAAITSMISGHHEHEAMMEQIQSSDTWSRYQAKKIKTLLRVDQIENLESAGRETPARLRKSVADAEKEEQKIFDEATEKSDSSRAHDRLHTFFGSAVTLFQVAIAVSAVSALTRRRSFWFVGISLGVVAMGFLCAGLLVQYRVVGHSGPEIRASAPQSAEAPVAK